MSRYYFCDYVAIESLVRIIRPVPIRYTAVLLPRQRGVTFVMSVFVYVFCIVTQVECSFFNVSP